MKRDPFSLLSLPLSPSTSTNRDWVNSLRFTSLAKPVTTFESRYPPSSYAPLL